MLKGGVSKMPKIVQYNLPPGGTVVDVAANNATALDIEQAGADYITVDTTGSGSVIIGKTLTLEAGMAFSGATTFEIPDNLENAFLVENETGGGDFISCDTRDGEEQLILAGGGAGVVLSNSASQFILPVVDRVATPMLAFGDGDTGIQEPWDDVLQFCVDEAAVFTLNALGFQAAAGAASPRLANENATATNPVFIIGQDNLTTGIGGVPGDEQIDLITDGVSRLKIDAGGVITPGSGAIQYHQGTGADTATTQAVYLADTNATLIIDFANGNVGDVTLAAGVTAVKFWNVPADGTSATVTARITQDSSARTIDYSDSAVTCYSDGGSSAVTGEIKFSGGVHHTMSTGSGDVDIISFTSIPTGSTFNIYAAVIGQDFS